MNRTNVLALFKALEQSDIINGLRSLIVTTLGEDGQPYQRNGVVALAERLAERGCLGPASEVLTVEEAVGVAGAAGAEVTFGKDTHCELCAALEHVAKGEPF